MKPGGECKSRENGLWPYLLTKYLRYEFLGNLGLERKLPE